MPTKKAKVANFTIPLWRWDVLIIAGDKDKSNKFLNKIDPNLFIGEFDQGSCFTRPDSGVIVWVDSLKNVPTLVHEILHAVFAVLSFRGLEHSKKSEEAYTYTVSHLLGEILAHKKWKEIK